MRRRRDHAASRQAPSISPRVPAAAILVFALLVFTWPFVRTPPLTLGESYLHLLGAWLGVVILLVTVSRAAGGGDGGAGGDA